MQRGRLGGIPLPRTFPIRDGLRLYREGRERFGGARCCHCARVRPKPSPRGATPREKKLKIKGENGPKVRTPPARVSP